jgi:AcrR family transcriptional regulator
MPPSEPPTRDARRRRGADTRRRVEQAAAELFTTAGYSATTMQAIADAAAVHVQTIYLAYGTKAAVLAASAARLVAGDEDPATHPSERRWAQQIQATEDIRRKLELYVEQILNVSERTTALIDMLRATAPSDPDVAAFLKELELGRREGPLRLIGPLAGHRPLRPGLTADDVADIVFALASPDTVRALMSRCGWTRERVASWLTSLLIGQLIDDGPAAHDRPRSRARARRSSKG